MYILLCKYYFCFSEFFCRGYIWGRKDIGLFGREEVEKMKCRCIYERIKFLNMKINFCMLLVNGGEYN